MTADELITGIVAAGGTARHVARVVGVSDALVCRWRSGERTPNGLQLWQLEQVYRLVNASVGVTVQGEGVLTPTGNRAVA